MQLCKQNLLRLITLGKVIEDMGVQDNLHVSLCILLHFLNKTNMYISEILKIQ